MIPRSARPDTSPIGSTNTEPPRPLRWNAACPYQSIRIRRRSLRQDDGSEVQDRLGRDDRQRDDDAQGDGHDDPVCLAALAAQDFEQAGLVRAGLHQGADGLSARWTTIEHDSLLQGKLSRLSGGRLPPG